ncbi:hypothetical protein HYZ41_01490 [archaeon]|nr:hypothetical protein [archaeon]
MAYQIGVSSGWWNIARDPALLGLASKVGFIATAGVTFNQIDVETISEFLEPKVCENVFRVKKELGLKIGMHAEIGENSALESAERQVWEQAHIRLVETVKNAVDLGVIYVNLHLSSLPILQFEEARIRPFGFQYQVVGPDGTPLWKLAETSKPAKDYIKSIISEGHMSQMISRGKDFKAKNEKIYKKYEGEARRREEEYIKKLRAMPEYERMSPAEKRLAENSEAERARKEVGQIIAYEREQLYNNPDELFDSWKKSDFEQYILEAGEIDAYMTVAHDMYKSNDMLWTNIVGSMDPEKAYVNKDYEFNAAVASKYIEGHLKTKNHPMNIRVLGGLSVLEYVNKTGLILCFEVPEVERGGRNPAVEGIYRLFDPRNSQWFVRKLGSPCVKLCIDFEHMLAQKLDPYKVIPQLPSDFGKLVYLFHLGEPKPYWGIAHIPIPLGSQAQEVIYEWLYMLRKKGFKDGVLIFERGSGRGGGKTTFEVFEQSVLVLRQIAQNLEKDIPPRELPLSFYGISEKNEAVYKREQVMVREHLMDPMEGLLSIPEEKHSFMSKAAVEKNKAQEWEKRKLR